MGKGKVVVGDIEVTPLVTSRFGLDGGSMFGFIPKPLWEKKAPADDENRIKLNVNTLLVEIEDRMILVEPGMGSKYDAKWKKIYALGDVEVESALDRIRVQAEEVDTVVITHLHLDHAGGSTRLGSSGEAVPVFPNARYVIQEQEYEFAVNPHPLAGGSYRSQDFMPLEERGLLKLVSGTEEIAPGVLVEHTGGHTPGHQAVRFVSKGEEALFPGDLVPTTAHLQLNWIMGWDLEPVVLYRQKKRYLEEAAEKNTLVFSTHDPRITAARLVKRGEDSFSMVEDTIVVSSP